MHRKKKKKPDIVLPADLTAALAKINTPNKRNRPARLVIADDILSGRSTASSVPPSPSPEVLGHASDSSVISNIASTSHNTSIKIPNPIITSPSLNSSDSIYSTPTVVPSPYLIFPTTATVTTSTCTMHTSTTTTSTLSIKNTIVYSTPLPRNNYQSSSQQPSISSKSSRALSPVTVFKNKFIDHIYKVDKNSLSAHPHHSRQLAPSL